MKIAILTDTNSGISKEEAENKRYLCDTYAGAD